MCRNRLGRRGFGDRTGRACRSRWGRMARRQDGPRGPWPRTFQSATPWRLAQNAAARVAGSDVVAGRGELIRGGRGREGRGRCAARGGGCHIPLVLREGIAGERGHSRMSRAVVPPVSAWRWAATFLALGCAREIRGGSDLPDVFVVNDLGVDATVDTPEVVHADVRVPGDVCDVQGTCNADFPCGRRRFVCLGTDRWSRVVTQPCSYRCGCVPCTGMSCESDGPTYACGPGERCSAPDLPTGDDLRASPCEPVDAGVIVDSPDAGIDCREQTADAGPGCRFSNGRFCPPYANCRSDDECNQCSCEERSDGSFGIGCTLIGCLGPRPDRPCFGGEAPGCRLPDGSWCPPGFGCPLEDGCTVCSCDALGGARCSDARCADGGARDCVNNEDCPFRHVCVASGPDCDAPKRCRFYSNLFRAQSACACDGRTVPAMLTPRGLYAVAPFRSVGPCPP